jgi:hypothetical protein
MSRPLVRVGPFLLALALLAAPASADVFFVTLTNGQVIQTAHQPQQATWDPNMVLLLTEVGNWIGFPKDQIQGVRIEDPTQGYGIRISDKAIALGRSPNDLPTEDDSTKSKADQMADRYLSLAERQVALQEARRNYSIQQFAEPSAAASNSMYITYSTGSGVIGGAFGGFSPGSGAGAPSEMTGGGSPTDFGGLSGAGSPPPQQ